MQFTGNSHIVNAFELAQGEIRFYQEEGYLLIPGLLERAAVPSLESEIYQIMEHNGAPLSRLQRAQSTKDKLIQSGQYLADSNLDRFINSPALSSVAAQLMGGPASLYMPFTAVKSGGGGGQFHFHQDNQYTRFDGPGLNMWFALSPMSPENGCLQVVPRSHLNGTFDAVQSPDGDSHRTVANDPTRFLPLRMQPGDCVAFSRLTLHGSGPNLTDAARVAYAVQFHRNDVNALREGQWKSLQQFPRWDTGPVEKLGASTETSRDGH